MESTDDKLGRSSGAPERKPIHRLSTPVRRDLTPLSKRSQVAKPLLKHQSPGIPSALPLNVKSVESPKPEPKPTPGAHHNPTPEDLGIQTDVDPDTKQRVPNVKTTIHLEVPKDLLEGDAEQLRPSTIIKPGGKERLSSGFSYKLHKFIKAVGMFLIVAALLAGLAIALEFRGVKGWFRGITTKVDNSTQLPTGP